MKARYLLGNGHHATVAGAGLLALGAAAGCATDPCTAGDDACILSHLRVYDQGGNPIPLTQVPGSAVKPMTRTGMGGSTGTGGTSSAVPVVTGLPSSTTFLDTSASLELTLQFTDPCGARPGGCFSVHHASNAGAEFTSPWVTTAPVYDQATQGQWPLQIGFDYTTSADDTFSLDFVAWSVCGSPVPDPVQAFDDGDSVAIGAVVEVAVTVDVPVDTSGSGGGDCVSPTVADTILSGCCSTGTCPAACADASGNGWYEVGTQVFGPCATGSSCLQGAANSALQACGL